MDCSREHGCRLAFIEPSGAMKGYAAGLPTGSPAPESVWMFGTNVAGIGAVADIEAVGYAADPERVRLDLEAYRPPGGWPDELVLVAGATAFESGTATTPGLGGVLRHQVSRS